MDTFEQELKAGFIEEALQLLGDAEQCFLSLETNPGDTATLEKLFRIAHNIKGSSKAVGFDALGAFTHEFETFMLKCKSGQIPILPGTVSLLLKCNDQIKTFIELLKENLDATLDCAPLVAEIHAFVPETEAVIEDEAPSASEAALLINQSPEGDFDAMVVEPETEIHPIGSAPEVVAVPVILPPPPPASVPVSAPASPPAGPGPAATSDESIRVSVARLERLLNYVGELVILQTVLREQAYGSNPNSFRKTIHQMGKVTKEVQDLSMSLRMVPMKQTFQKMQRIVRDTSAILGKKVQLTLLGDDTEVDKTVLEALGDPLVHLIRNAVDHGIEVPADRVARGKGDTGQITLRAFHQSGKLVIEVQDDGGGIPADRLRQKAVEKGILRKDQTISDQEAVNLIFHAGFSTKNQVTEVSGRGVGMDVVKTNIEQLQGEVTVETRPGAGSTFRVVLPLTLAIIDGMVVRSGDERYVIPLTHVHETVRPESRDLKFATGLGEVLLLRGENLPVFRLSQALGKRRTAEAASEQIAIIVRSEAQPFAALVDDVIGQYQVVIKKLGQEAQNLKGFSGSAILGDGRPALILELADLAASTSANKGKRTA